MNRFRVRAWLSATLIACIIPVYAQDKPGMSIVDMLNVPQLSNPQMSPDGSAVVYELADADWKLNKRITHIWRQSVESGDPVQLTNGVEGESDPVGHLTANTSLSWQSVATMRNRRSTYCQRPAAKRRD